MFDEENGNIILLGKVEGSRSRDTYLRHTSPPIVEVFNPETIHQAILLDNGFAFLNSKLR